MYYCMNIPVGVGVDMYYCMNIHVGAGAAAEVDGPGTGDREPEEASGC